MAKLIPKGIVHVCSNCGIWSGCNPNFLYCPYCGERFEEESE